MEPFFALDVINPIVSYKTIIQIYEKALKKGDFYEEPICQDFIYPDW